MIRPSSPQEHFELIRSAFVVQSDRDTFKTDSLNCVKSGS